MGADYYKILGVSKTATPDQLKHAYRKLAATSHPDKHSAGTDAERDAATAKFKEIGEAYDVLSDPEKRQVYDVYGEEGLKGGAPPPDREGYPAGPEAVPVFRGGYEFDANSAQRIFEHMFGGMAGGNGMGSMGGMGGRGVGGMMGNQQGMFQSGGRPATAFSFFGPGNDGERPYSRGRSYSPPDRPARQRAQEVELLVTLEQLYTGIKKKLRVTRKLRPEGSKPQLTQEVLELDVVPGWKQGTRITFSGKGDELPHGRALDLMLTVIEQPHDTFHRMGNNLYVTLQVPLVTALTGGILALKHLDGHTVQIPVLGVMQPGTEKVIVGEGMPISKTPGAKGDLIVKCQVVFPKSLTSDQKEMVRNALG